MDGNKRGADRILSFVRALGTALKRNGLAEILDAKPYLAIRLTLEKTKPVSLKNRMDHIVEMNRDAGFHKKDFWAFMQRMEAEAIKHEEVEEELARQKGKSHDHTLSSRPFERPNDATQPATPTRTRERRPRATIGNRLVQREHLYRSSNRTLRISRHQMTIPARSPAVITILTLHDETRSTSAR